MDNRRLTDEQIKKASGASDEYWATSKLFIIAIARAIEDAHGIGAHGVARRFPKPAGYVTDIKDGAGVMLTDEDDIGVAVLTAPQLEAYRADGVEASDKGVTDAG